MKRGSGYILMLVGLAVLILAPTLADSFLSSLPKMIIYGLGVLVMVVGFFLTLSKKQMKELKEELPIYEGEKVVAYRRNKK